MAPYEQAGIAAPSGGAESKPAADSGPADEVTLDLVADLNAEGLAGIADESQDFVIASHVLEHLAAPLRFIDEIHRVLRPGGLAMILLPDRHRTEDRFRDPTALDHLAAEHRSGVTAISDEHIVEYSRDRGRRLPRRGPERTEIMERLRANSFHVHVWDAGEFMDVVRWGVEHGGHQWELVDGSLHEPPIHYEFGYVLRRATDAESPPARAAELRAAWDAWRARYEPGQVEGRPVSRTLRVLKRNLRTAKRRTPALAWAAETTGAAARTARRLGNRLGRPR